MEAWRTAWRDGFAVVLSTLELEALHAALQADDPRLIQGRTVTPSSSHDWTHDCPVEAGCAVVFCGWRGKRDVTVGDAKEFFNRTVSAAVGLIGIDGCSDFLNWFDDTPRDVMRRELLAEVGRTLLLRESQ